MEIRKHRGNSRYGGGVGWTACWPIFAPEHQMMWDTQICIKIGISDFLDKYLHHPGHFRGFFAKI